MFDKESKKVKVVNVVMVDFLLGFRCSVRNDPRAAQIPIIIPYITPAKITMPKDAKQNKPRCVLLEKETLAFLATIVSKNTNFLTQSRAKISSQLPV